MKGDRWKNELVPRVGGEGYGQSLSERGSARATASLEDIRVGGNEDEVSVGGAGVGRAVPEGEGGQGGQSRVGPRSPSRGELASNVGGQRMGPVPSWKGVSKWAEFVGWRMS